MNPNASSADLQWAVHRYWGFDPRTPAIAGWMLNGSSVNAAKYIGPWLTSWGLIPIKYGSTESLSGWPWYPHARRGQGIEALNSLQTKTAAEAEQVEQ